MRRVIFVCAVAVAVALSAPGANIDDSAIQPVPCEHVEITDAFWAPRIEANRTVSIRHVFARSEEHRGTAPAQLVEAAAHMLAARPDPALEAHADETIARYGARVGSLIARPEDAVRTPGTFLEAAGAYFRATGKRAALDAAIKAADAMAAAYGPGRKTYISGHQGLKIGLLSLFRETGDARYLDLVRFFLDERGKDDYPREGEYEIDRTYAQDHAPVIHQTEAVGHAVRATYLYIALADVAALTGRPEYRRALDSIWQDAVHRKTYLTGGIGSIRFHEQFGGPYDLPNLSAWNETCASYGNVLWNHRMFLLHRNAQYLDQMERVLYNALLVGVSLKGDRFFYQNPLMSYGNYERFDWIDTPCCPPNVVRMLASVGRYIYASEPDALYVNLFVGSRSRITLGGTAVKIQQDTRYPWDGGVRVAVDPERTARFTLYVRMPGWTRDEVMPGGLYRFADEARRQQVTIRINGRAIEPPVERGFAAIDRDWRPGDVVDLTLPMSPRRVIADDRVRDTEGRVALQMGPIVYAAEWPDNNGRALNIVMPDSARLQSEFRPDLLNGVAVIRARAQAIEQTPDGTRRIAPHDLVAIPYYAWANRGMGEMQVWLARQPSRARVAPIVPSDPIAVVRSSGGVEKKWTGYNDQNDDIAAVYDAADPLSSADESNLYFRMRPAASQAAWVEYEFKRPVTLRATDAYFVDDRRFCRLPASWRLLYREGSQWKAVAALGPYPVAKDQFAHVDFSPVTTTAVRIEIEPATRHYRAGEIGPPGAMFLTEDIDWRECGLIEWRVK